MTEGPESQETSAPRLDAALLEYFGAPGNYQLTLRQPVLLFGSVREVLQIASGNHAAGESAAVREAAAFFIRAAFLYPGADHYALFGLPSRTEPVQLKERYRLLMRLIHPDFAGAAGSNWPADAAVRVNRAYEVLSSPVLRREYDEQLASAALQRPGPPARVEPLPRALPRREEARAGLNWKAVWILGSCGGLLFLLTLVPRQEPIQLVQNRGTGVSWRPSLSLAEVTVRPAAAPAPVAHVPPATPVTPVAPPVPAAPLAPVASKAAVQPLVAAAPQQQPPKPQQLPPTMAPVAVAPAPVPRPAPTGPMVRPRDEAPTALAATAQRPESPPPERQTAPAAATPAAATRVRDDLPAPLAVVAPVATFSPEPEPPRPTLTDAQPLLSQLLQLMESGSGEQLLRLLEADARKAPAAQALSRQYEQAVRGARPIRLTQVEFRSEGREGMLLVTGRIRLHAGEPTIGSHGEKLSVRAEFVTRGGRVLMTALSGGPD